MTPWQALDFCQSVGNAGVGKDLRPRRVHLFRMNGRATLLDGLRLQPTPASDPNSMCASHKPSEVTIAEEDVRLPLVAFLHSR